MALEIIKFQFDDVVLRKYAFEIRHKVFVIEQKCPPELEYENEEISTHYIVKNNKTFVATARYRYTSNGIKLERFAVLKKYRRQGIAWFLLNKILEDVKIENKQIYLHSQVTAINLYKKAGFEIHGKMFEEAGIEHFKMIYRNRN